MCVLNPSFPTSASQISATCFGHKTSPHVRSVWFEKYYTTLVCNQTQTTPPIRTLHLLRHVCGDTPSLRIQITVIITQGEEPHLRAGECEEESKEKLKTVTEHKWLTTLFFISRMKNVMNSEAALRKPHSLLAHLSLTWSRHIFFILFFLSLSLDFLVNPLCICIQLKPRMGWRGN